MKNGTEMETFFVITNPTKQRQQATSNTGSRQQNESNAINALTTTTKTIILNVLHYISKPYAYPTLPYPLSLSLSALSNTGP